VTTTLIAESTPKWTDLLKPGAAAVKRYWRPFLALQAMAVILVVTYYNSEGARRLCDTLSDIRKSWGIWFVLISSPIAGVVVPEIAKSLMLRGRRYDGQWLSDTLYAMALFTINGVIIDAIYRLQAMLFGDDASFTTVLCKVLADQFIMTPIYGIPYWAIMFGWRRNGYSVLATAREISPRWYMSKVLPIMIPAWLYWFPMVTMVFAMPGPLQFWLFCLAIAAWSLVMLFLARGEGETPAESR
jgi:hypothetical protein